MQQYEPPDVRLQRGLGFGAFAATEAACLVRQQRQVVEGVVVDSVAGPLTIDAAALGSAATTLSNYMSVANSSAIGQRLGIHLLKMTMAAERVIERAACLGDCQVRDIDAVILAGQLCERDGHDFALVPGPRAVQRMFELTGLIDVLPFLEPRTDAEPEGSTARAQFDG